MAQAPARKIRLTLVDDHEVVRLGLRSLFGQAAHIEIVAQAGTVAEAVSQAARLHPDVVLMDMRGCRTGQGWTRAGKSARPTRRCGCCF